MVACSNYDFKLWGQAVEISILPQWFWVSSLAVRLGLSTREFRAWRSSGDSVRLGSAGYQASPAADGGDGNAGDGIVITRC